MINVDISLALRCRWMLKYTRCLLYYVFTRCLLPFILIKRQFLLLCAVYCSMCQISFLLRCIRWQMFIAAYIYQMSIGVHIHQMSFTIYTCQLSTAIYVHLTSIVAHIHQMSVAAHVHQMSIAAHVHQMSFTQGCQLPDFGLRSQTFCYTADFTTTFLYMLKTKTFLHILSQNHQQAPRIEEFWLYFAKVFCDSRQKRKKSLHPVGSACAWSGTSRLFWNTMLATLLLLLMLVRYLLLFMHTRCFTLLIYISGPSGLLKLITWFSFVVYLLVLLLYLLLLYLLSYTNA